MALRKSQVAGLVQQGSRAAKAVKSLQDDPERFLATVQIGITVISAAAGAFGGATFARDLAPLLAPLPWIGRYADQIALGLVISFVSYLSLVLGELVPKSLALRSSQSYALLIGRPLLLLSKVARPFVWLLTRSSNVVLRLFGDSTTFTEARVSGAEIQRLVDEAARDGSVHPAVGEIASRAIDFGELTAYHVMVPRERVVTISRSATADDVRRVLLEEGHTRMPVHDGRVENVIGYVTVRDILALFWQRGLVLLEDAIRPALFVPASQRAVDLLRELRERGVQLAIIVDESGAMVGIVTLEDLVEELVGEIIDEHGPDPGSKLEPQPDGSFLAAATLPVRDVNRRLGLDLPDGHGRSTLAGLCIHLTGRIPTRGDRVTLTDGTEIDVIEATPRRVVRVRPPAARRPGREGRGRGRLVKSRRRPRRGDGGETGYFLRSRTTSSTRRLAWRPVLTRLSPRGLE